MMDFTLTEKMKAQEALGASYERMPDGQPVIIRLDGRAFSSFTKGLQRPFDSRFSRLMIETTKYLVKETNACIGYTASDEITLILNSDKEQSQVYFDGRRDKINSILAAQCSVFFNEELASYIPEKYLIHGMSNNVSFPVFDCRTFSVPTKEWACWFLAWRERDCSRNSIQTAGQAYFSHNRLNGLSTREVRELLMDEKGIDWHDYPTFYKRGSYFQRKTFETPFTQEEISLLPPKHEARTNPNLLVKRRHYDVIEMPPIQRVTNLEDVVFKGKEPNFVRSCDV